MASLAERGARAGGAARHAGAFACDRLSCASLCFAAGGPGRSRAALTEPSSQAEFQRLQEEEHALRAQEWRAARERALAQRAQQRQEHVLAMAQARSARDDEAYAARLARAKQRELASRSVYGMLQMQREQQLQEAERGKRLRASSSRCVRQVRAMAPPLARSCALFAHTRACARMLDP